MRRSKLFMVVVAALVFGLVSTAVAASVHLKRKPPLTFTDQGLTLNATGALTGLGNGDIVVELTAQGQPVATCTNPAGATQPPGQNPAVVEVSGAQQIPAGEIKNGNVAFNVSTAAPETPIAGAPDCPNSMWTEDINDVIFSGFPATITVYQGIGCAVDPSTGEPNANCVQVFETTQTVP
jgi:hypothetical protein